LSFSLLYLLSYQPRGRRSGVATARLRGVEARWPRGRRSALWPRGRRSTPWPQASTASRGEEGAPCGHGEDEALRPRGRRSAGKKGLAAAMAGAAPTWRPVRRREHARTVPLLCARRRRGRRWRKGAHEDGAAPTCPAVEGNTPVEIGIGGRWERPRLYGHGEESRWVLAPYSHMNGVWRVDLGAHPKLGALVGTLLELRFLSEHSYLVMGAQVGGVYWSCSNGPLQLHERRHIFFGNPKFEWRRVPLLLVYWVRPW
jgi:hypothetical protein